MRKIIVFSMITLDGTLQAPGGPEEDTSGNFEYGGWTALYGDDILNNVITEELKPADYLLGRKTFDIFAAYWPHHAEFWPAINEGTKYVLSHTNEQSDWGNTVFIKGVEDIKKIKEAEGPDLHVWGSSELIQLLFEHDLADELRLKIYPIVLGKGKKLFGKGTLPAAFKLTESHITTKGIIIAAYERDGAIKTGTVEI